MIFLPRQILCPTDFSDYSDAALKYAGLLAETYKSEITLLHVNEFESLPYLQSIGSTEDVQGVRDSVHAYAELQFERIKREVLPRGLTVRHKIICGRTYKAIIEESDEHEYDLIVISTRGHTKLSQHIIGSDAERIVRFARKPVLSIEGKAFPEKFTVRNILLPTDFSECSTAALIYAFSIARAYHAKVYWLYVARLENEPLATPMSHFPDPKKYDKKADEVEFEMVVDKDIEPSNSIIRFEQGYDIDLIVMGVHGKKGIRRVFIGNNTAEVVRQAKCPVLTVAHPMHKIVFMHSATEQFEEEKPEES